MKYWKKILKLETNNIISEMEGNQPTYFKKIYGYDKSSQINCFGENLKIQGNL